MMRLLRRIADDLAAHARAEAPIEACGLLAGTGEAVAEAFRLTNVDHSPEHFSLDPREQLRAVRAAREAGREIIAVYHSHPATPARMSAEDLRLAVAPGMCYVILSLADPQGPQFKAFRVTEGVAIEEPLLIAEEDS
jgi:proteasome lid subunit RPN8/RPN11